MGGLVQEQGDWLMEYVCSGRQRFTYKGRDKISTEFVKFICANGDFSDSFCKSVWSILVHAKNWIEDLCKKAFASIVGIKDADRGDGTR